MRRGCSAKRLANIAFQRLNRYPRRRSLDATIIGVGDPPHHQRLRYLIMRLLFTAVVWLIQVNLAAAQDADDWLIEAGSETGLPRVTANDNRVPAGTLKPVEVVPRLGVGETADYLFTPIRLVTKN